MLKNSFKSICQTGEGPAKSEKMSEVSENLIMFEKSHDQLFTPWHVLHYGHLLSLLLLTCKNKIHATEDHAKNISEMSTCILCVLYRTGKLWITVNSTALYNDVCSDVYLLYDLIHVYSNLTYVRTMFKSPKTKNNWNVCEMFRIYLTSWNK